MRWRTVLLRLANASFSLAFNRTGAYPYHCRLHPSMTGTVTGVETHAGRP